MTFTKPFTMQDGYITIKDGSGTALEYTIPFKEGGLSFQGGEGVIEQKNQNKHLGIRAGVTEALKGSFSAKIKDENLYRIADERVFPDQSESLTGLTGGAANDVTTAYPFVAGSLSLDETSPSPTKLAVGVAPTADNEYSEKSAGSANIHDVTVVSNSAANAEIYQPSADTTATISYDAAASSTAENPTCDDLTLLDIIFTIRAPNNGTTVLKTWTFKGCVMQARKMDEAAEADTVQIEFTSEKRRPIFA